MILATGSTSVSLDIQIVDDSGLPVTGLVAATFPAVSWSLAGPTAATAITLSDLAAITTAYTSGGVKERSNGYYRLDVPNAAFASAGEVKLLGEATGKHLLCEPIVVSLPKTAATLNATDVTGNLPSDLQTIKTQTVTCAAGVTIGTVVSSLTQTQVTGGAYPLATDGSGNIKISSGTGTGQLSLTSGVVDANAVKMSGTALTGRDIGASVLLSSGTGTGQIVLTSGKVTVGTNSDKTGYSLTQTFPANFSALAIDVSGNLTGSVGFVAGDVDGSLTGNVIGDVQGKLLGGGIATPTAVGAWVANGSGNPVATAAAQTTLQNAVNALPSASTIATTVWGVLTSALTTAGSIGKLLATLLFDGSGNVKSTPQTDPTGVTTLLTRVGSPAGASVSADVAAVKASVGSPMQAGTQVVLASNGLDQIATTTSGAPSTWKFPQWIMWLVRRWVRTTYDSNAQTMVVKDAAGTTISTQTATNAAGVQTTGELS